MRRRVVVSRPVRWFERFLLVVFLAGLLVLFAGALAGRGARMVDRWTATAATRRAWMWIDTPDVSPGGTVHLRVRTDGELQSRIDEVTVRVGDDAPRVRGRKSEWGWFLIGRQKTADEMAFEVPVPAVARAGDRLPIEVSVDIVFARRAGPGTFDDTSTTYVLNGSVAVRSASALRWRRFASGSFAILALAVVMALPAWFARSRKARPREPGISLDGTAVLYLVVIVLFVAAGALGQLLFARPLMRALDNFDSTLAYALPTIWVIAPIAAFVIAHLAAPPRPARIFARAVLGPPGSPHRSPKAQGPATASRAADPVPLATVAAALEHAGLRVSRGRRRLTIASRVRTPVRIENEDPQRVTPESLALTAPTLEDALAVVTVLAEVFGPLEVSSLGEAQCIIERSASVEAPTVAHLRL